MIDQNQLGNCNCMNRDHKLLILRVFKEAIENQKDAINRVESTRADIIKKGWSPEQFIKKSREFIQKLENTRKAAQDIPDCKH